MKHCIVFNYLMIIADISLVTHTQPRIESWKNMIKCPRKVDFCYSNCRGMRIYYSEFPLEKGTTAIVYFLWLPIYLWCDSGNSVWNQKWLRMNCLDTQDFEMWNWTGENIASLLCSTLSTAQSNQKVIHHNGSCFSINQSNVFIKLFLHQMSQSAIQKTSLEPQSASNADVEAFVKSY
jgi:hypothetical protein